MTRPLITIDLIDNALRRIATEHGGRPQLQFAFSDARVDWASIGRCDNGGLPAVDCGQSNDCRFSRPDGSSVHAHWFPRESLVRFHRDKVDPREDPLGHVFTDTRAPWGLLGGGLAGLLLSRGSGWGALVGAAVGTALGVASEAIPTGGVWLLDTVREDGSWTAHRLGDEQRAAQPA